ncbi:hypothetical protein LCGC14_1775940 [marine sediment metagenome]|uniref:Site-specific DNA-methyltransferase (adenine-specific) n=1 Tax=marine sediment metagenome TaxID=412755 RepID=A0A0F9JBU0_9ZZZZ
MTTQAKLLVSPIDKYEKLNINDIVFTPKIVAEFIIELYKPEGKCLDPCMGEGGFFNLLPIGSDWCEITKGRDFFDYQEKVDWIFTNPPYSNFNMFMEHSFELAENVMFLVPIAKVFKSWGTMKKIKKYGGIKAIWFVPANRCGFPFGFPAGAFHFKRNYNGDTKIIWAEI